VFVLLNVGEEEKALVLCEKLLQQVCCRVPQGVLQGLLQCVLQGVCVVECG